MRWLYQSCLSELVKCLIVTSSNSGLLQSFFGLHFCSELQSMFQNLELDFQLQKYVANFHTYIEMKFLLLVWRLATFFRNWKSCQILKDKLQVMG